MKLAIQHGPMYTYSDRLCTEWYEACQYLIFDACLSMALIRLHLGQGLEIADRRTRGAARCAMASCHLPPESLSHLHHITALVKAHQEKCSEACDFMEDAVLAREMAGLAVDPGLECELKRHQAHVAKHDKRPGGASILALLETSNMRLTSYRKFLTRPAARFAAPRLRTSLPSSRRLSTARSLRAWSAGTTCTAN